MCRGRTTLLLPVLATAVVAAAPPVRAQEPLKPKAVRQLLESPKPLTFVPGEAIVKLKAPEAAAFAEPQLTALGLDSETRRTSGGEIVVRLGQGLVGALADEELESRTLEMIEELEADPAVEWAQPNYILHPVREPDDPRYDDQWHYHENGDGAGESRGGINLPTAWETTVGDPSVVVAVIDTGILPDHPDIAGSVNLVPGYDMISQAFNAKDGDGRDADPTDPGDAVLARQCGGGKPRRDQPSSWHGTHVAGTVGVGHTDNGVGVAGVAWRTGVQAVRVLGRCGGTTVDINDAIRWAAGLPVPEVPNNPTPAKVINMSLGGEATCGSSPSTQAAIDDAVAQGTTVVVAAGNSTTDAANFFPASCDGVITVAASDPRGLLVRRYSNYGETIELLAPGGNVMSRTRDGVLSMVKGGYAFYNGTSMAAPHVAGVAALMLAENPGLSPAEVLARLQANAQPRSDGDCWRPCGAGLLDADVFSDKLRLAPSGIGLGESESRTLSATVVHGGAPAAGVAVDFSSDDPAIASVAPASAVTDGNGRAEVTVTRSGEGETRIVARAEGRSARTEVRRVPLSDLGFVLAALLTALRLGRRGGTAEV